MATISTSYQKVAIDDVLSILVTDITTDSQGRFVRAIRFYGAAIDGSSNLDLIHEVRVTSANKPQVQIPVPASGF